MKFRRCPSDAEVAAIAAEQEAGRCRHETPRRRLETAGDAAPAADENKEG